MYNIVIKEGKRDIMFNQVTNEFIVNTVVNKGTIRKSIPKSYGSLERYVLRMVQFYSGVNSHMPMTADFDLKDYCTSMGVEFKYVGAESKAIRKEIDDILFNFCKDNGLLGGVKRWARALGY